MFKPEEHKFYSHPAIGIGYNNEIFNIYVYDKKLASAIKPGVYAWTITKETGEIEPVYIGLYGETAQEPSLQNRFNQHLGGLNSTLRGNPPTKHWRDHLVPAAKDYLKDGGKKIDIYFGHFDRDEVVNLEKQLIRRYQPVWNSRGVVR